MVCIIVVLFKHRRMSGDTTFITMFGNYSRREIHAEQEFDNPMDKFGVRVIYMCKNSETVCHLTRKYSQISSLVFSCTWWKESK